MGPALFLHKIASTFVSKNLPLSRPVFRRCDVGVGSTPPQNPPQQSEGCLWRSIIDRRAAQNCSPIISAFRANDAGFLVEPALDAREFLALHRAGELR